MGIAEAITRVKEGARRAGLEAVLRAGSIPAPLRPAAQKLADLLKADQPAQPVVSLDAAIAAQAEQAHAGVSHDEMAAAGGVCPFSGMNASMASLFEAPGLEVVHTVDAMPSPDAQPSEASAPEEAELISEVPVAIAEAEAVPQVASAKPGPKAPSARVAGARAKVASSDKKPAAKPVSKPAVKASAKVAPVAVSAPAKKKAQVKAEKVVGKLAAKPSSSKTPARSTVVASARPATKRPIAKVAKKKD